MANLGKNIPIVYDKKADMIADPNLIEEGQVVRTLGLVYLGDGLGSYYKLVSSLTDPSVATNYPESMSPHKNNLYFVPVKIDVTSESFDAVEASYTEILTSVQSVRNDLSNSITNLETNLSNRVNSLETTHSADNEALVNRLNQDEARITALEEGAQTSNSNIEELSSSLEDLSDGFRDYKSSMTEQIQTLTEADSSNRNYIDEAISTSSQELSSRIAELEALVNKDRFDIKTEDDLTGSGVSFKEYFGGDKTLTFNPDNYVEPEGENDSPASSENYFGYTKDNENNTITIDMGYEGHKPILPLVPRLEGELNKTYSFDNDRIVFEIIEKMVQNPDYVEPVVTPDEPDPTDPTENPGGESGGENTDPTTDPGENTNPDESGTSTEPTQGDQTPTEGTENQGEENSGQDDDQTTNSEEDQTVDPTDSNTDDTTEESGDNQDTDPTDNPTEDGDENEDPQPEIPQYVKVKLINLTIDSSDRFFFTYR